MARPDPGARLPDIERYRAQVLSQPLAGGIEPEAVQSFLAGLPAERFPSFVYAARAHKPLVQPRGGVPTFEGQHALTWALCDAGADFIPLTVDSLTRQNRYDTATELLRRSEDEGKNYLNGYPLVSHGFEVTRGLYEALQRPVSLRHGTPDARLLVEVAIASGIVEIEGGGICYCLPYSEGFPLDRSLLYWQYVDRICAEYSTPDRPVHRESFGPLTATLVPPAIAIVVEIIEALLAAEQGVKSFTVSFGQTGSIVQDVATANVLRALVREFLDEHGFETTRCSLGYHQWMGQFPAQRARAAGLIAGSALVAAMIDADKVIVKTVDEALGVPDADVNAEAVDSVQHLLRVFRCFDPLTSPKIIEETRLLESETRAILNAVFALPGDAFWESVYRAFRLGFIDVPFSPHSDNANQLLAMRDANGSIRIADRGRVPISDEDAKEERRLLQSGTAAPSYRQLLADINFMI